MIEKHGPLAFNAIAVEHEHRWKYRGQVRPSDGTIAITVQITDEKRDGDRLTTTANASLWIDDRRIYEATIAQDASTSRWSRAGMIEPAITWWRRRFDRSPIPRERLVRALVERFVGRVELLDAAALDAIDGPLLFVANHQTAIETLLFAIVAGPPGNRPLLTLAKAEHRESWFGALIASLLEGTGHDLIDYFDRSDPTALGPWLERAFDRMERERLSLLLHVEGTRASSARTPLGAISGVPIDHAVRRNVSIVPVRFSGGLPMDAAPRKLDFPLHLARQDIWIGRPIAPSSLAPLPYAERVASIRRAIEQLGPPHEIEQPNEGDRDLEARVHERMARDGTSEIEALLAILEH
jgi:1-acyl-sn-glycerol-3-phosphate acyltransferase